MSRILLITPCVLQNKALISCRTTNKLYNPASTSISSSGFPLLLNSILFSHYTHVFNYSEQDSTLWHLFAFLHFFFFFSLEPSATFSFWTCWNNPSRPGWEAALLMEHFIVPPPPKKCFVFDFHGMFGRLLVHMCIDILQ